jgi:hypothetical protein
MAYIDSNADQPITLSDIATATATGARALQNAFRHDHDTPGLPTANTPQTRHLDLTR